MARDNIKAIIERGRQNVPSQSFVTTATMSDKKAKKIAKEVVIEKPYERKLVHAIKTIRGIRR